MHDSSRTNQELIKENTLLKKKNQELERCLAEHKLAEEELKESYVARYSLTGILLFGSSAMCYVTGYKPEEIKGTSGFNRVHPDDRPQVQAALKEAIQQRVSRKVEYRAICKDRGYKWVEMSAKVVHNDQTGREEVIAVVRDIDKRKCAEKELLESEKRFRAIADHTPGWEDWVGTDGKLIWVNPSVYNLTGYSAEECMQMNDYPAQMAHDADRERMMSAFKSSVQGSTGKNVEFRLLCKDGNVKWGDASWQPIYDKDSVHLGHRVSIRDITSRKQAEEALQASEARYRTIVENANDAIYIHDFEGNIIDVNENACNMVGYMRDELVGANLSMIDKDWLLPENKELDRLIGKERIIFERENVHTDGFVVPVEVSVKVISHDGKGIVLGFVRNITDRKQAEEKSQNMLNFLQILINTIPSPIFRKDIHGRYQDCNKEFENYTGLRREEISGKSVYDMYPKDVADKYHEMDLALFREPGRQIYEYQIIYADGEKHDVVVNKATYFNADGTLGGLVGVMVDITERKRAEWELRESETKYRRLVETLNEGVWQIDKGGYTSFVNATMSEMLGYRTDEMLGKHLFEFMDESGVERAQHNIERRKQGLKERHDFEFLHKDGTRIHVSISTTPIIDEKGNYAGALAAVRDITEIKEAEEELAKYREGLERLVKERTHELRNKTKTLEEVNIALKVLLQHREEDKKELEDKIVMNVKNMIIPFAEKMKSTNLDDRQLAYLNIIATHLNEITSPMIKKMHQFNFTPTEVEVASLIKEGKATKEIAKIIGIATCSINTHRNNIRKKLGISQEKINLRSHLQSFD